MSDPRPIEDESGPSSPRNPARIYIVIAAVLVVVIVIAAILLFTVALPALRGEEGPTAVSGPEATATITPVPTFTPAPTREPTHTPQPSPVPTLASLLMADTGNPLFVFESAGARPGVDWTGFFGQVLDAAGNPLPGVPLIVWYRDGQPASAIVPTDQEGAYEIHLASAPLAGTWTLQVLTADGQPASNLLTFQTDENSETGIQQIQVIWRGVP